MIQDERELSDIRIVTAERDGGEFRLEFVEACVPENPFYIRWINNLGGWEYHMFDPGYNVEEVMENADGYYPYIEDTSFARERDVPYKFDGYVEFTLLEEGVDKETYDLLKSVKFSPRIEWYNTAIKQYEGSTEISNGTWIRLSYVEGSTSWNTRGVFGDIDMTLRLPKLYTQSYG